MITVDLENLNQYEKVLSDTSAPVADRVDSLFCMKAFSEVEAVDAIIRSFHCEKKSELLKHEICYCLGQMNKTDEHVKRIQTFLEYVIDDKNNYEEIVVHEAVEAMGNLAEENTLSLIQKYENENKTSSMLYETCFLARELINWKKNTDNGKSENLDFSSLKFKTNDPAPPFSIYNGREIDQQKVDIENL